MVRQERGDGFCEERKRLFLAALRLGYSVLAACRAIGISNRTAYNHRDRDPGFAREWELARQTSATPIELEAWQRAVEALKSRSSLTGGR